MISDEINIILSVNKDGQVQTFRINNDNTQKFNKNLFQEIEKPENDEKSSYSCPKCHENLIINLFIPLESTNEMEIDDKIEENKNTIKIKTENEMDCSENILLETKNELIQVQAWPAIESSDDERSDRDEIIQHEIQPVETIKKKTVKVKTSIKSKKLKKTPVKKKNPTVVIEKCIVDPPKDESLPFSCEICKKSFKNKLALSTHKRYCSAARIRFCSECNKTYNSFYLYHMHLQTAHGVNPRHQCPECDKAFISPSKLKEHIMNIHQKIRHKCDECDAKFKNQYVLNAHMRDKHGIDNTLRRTCKLCVPSRRFDGDLLYKEHLRDEHNVENDEKLSENSEEPLRCTSCNVIFKNDLALSTHQKYCNPEMPSIGKPTCKYCGKFYSTWYTVKEHIKTEHLGNTFQCELCGKQLRNKFALAEHLLRHDHPKPMSCHHCGKRFVSKDRVKVHIMAKHLDQANFICEICSKRFVGEKEMTKHKAIVHTEERPFQCTECPKSFKSDIYLKNHVFAMHTPDEMKKKFCCPSCDFVTSRLKYLDNHKKTHLDDSEKLPCRYCDRRFAIEYHRDRHEMIHTGERPFKCDLCEQSFITRVEKREHFIKHHTQDKPFICEVCQEGFADRWQYRNHLTRHENESKIVLNKSVRKFMFKYRHI